MATVREELLEIATEPDVTVLWDTFMGSWLDIEADLLREDAA